MYDREQPLGGFAARREELRVSGAMVVTQLGVHPMTRSIRLSVAAVLLVALVGVASGQTTLPAVPESWNSLDVAGLTSVAVQLRDQGAAGEPDRKLLAGYVAQRYASAAAAGPVEWGQWLDLACLLGPYYPAETQAAMAQSIKSSLAATAEAVSGMSPQAAASVAAALGRLGKADGDIVSGMSSELRAAWLAKIQAGLTGTPEAVASVSVTSLQGSALYLRQQSAGMAAANMMVAWLRNEQIASKLATMDLGDLLQAVPQNDAVAAKIIIAELEPRLAAQHARLPLWQGTCTTLAYRLSELGETAKAREWAVRTYQTYLGTEQAKAAANEELLRNLMGMPQIVAQDGQAKVATQMMAGLEQVLLAQNAKTPLSWETCKQMAFRQVDVTLNQTKAREWGLRAYRNGLASEEAKASASVEMLVEIARMVPLVAADHQLDAAQEMVSTLEPLLVARDGKSPLGWQKYKTIADCWKAASLPKAREWAMRAYVSALGTEQARAAADEQTITEVVEVLKAVGLVDQVAADAVMAGLEPMWETKAGQAPLQWQTCRTFAEICLARKDSKKAQEWAQRAYQIALGAEQSQAAANEETLLLLSSMLGKAGLTGEDVAYPEYVSVLIRLAREDKLDARYWGGPESAIPGATQDALPAVQAELFNGQGSPRLAVAQVLAWTYKKVGQLPLWQKTVDEKIAGTELSGDAKAGWLLVRAYAESIQSESRSPLAGKGWLDQALTTASSTPVRFLALKELVGGYMLIGEHDKALAAMDSLTQQFTEKELATQFTALRAQVVQDKPAYAEAVARAKAEQEAQAARAWKQELQRRLEVSRQNGDSRRSQQLEHILSRLDAK